MALAREFLARALVALAVVMASVALGCWWSSLLVIRAAGTLNAITENTVTHQITTQLDHLAPGTTRQPNVAPTISRALHDPAVTQALASSVPEGSAVLSATLSRLDSGLAPLLRTGPLVVDVGQHALANLARDLRSVARLAALLAALTGAGALAISPLRHLILRHLAFAAGLVGCLGVLLAWGLPALVGHLTHGSVHRFAETILSGGYPVRSVLVEAAIGGATLYLATHLFELVGGNRQFRTDAPTAPLPQGRVV